MKRHICLFFIPILSSVAFAEETKSLSGKVEFGWSNNTGNTESTSIIAKADVKQELTSWRNHFVVESAFKQDQQTLTVDDVEEEETVTTQQKFFASMQNDYKLNNDHAGLFFYSSYERDRFSGFDYQATLALGYSNRWFETENAFLDYSIGPGYTFNEAQDSDETSETLITRISANYEYKISENAKFTQAISGDISFDSEENSKIRSNTAVTANLNSAFALSASYTVTHNTEVEEPIESTDAQTAVTLIYSF